MSNTPHELAAEFPGQADRLHALKAANAHFARLVEEYHDINRAVHRAETRAEIVTEDHEARLRKRRLALKDEIARMLAAG
ncbi:MAG: YdcH family protein [Gemmobacter sp.]